MTRSLSGLVGLLLLFALSGCSDSQDRPNYPLRRPPEGLFDDVAQRQAGHTLFLAKCASCHGHPDEGRSPRAGFFKPPAPDFTEARYLREDPAYLFWRIEVGKTVEPYLSQGSVMPAWSGLPDAKIWQLVAYLKSRAGN